MDTETNNMLALANSIDEVRWQTGKCRRCPYSLRRDIVLGMGDYRGHLLLTCELPCGVKVAVGRKFKIFEAKLGRNCNVRLLANAVRNANSMRRVLSERADCDDFEVVQDTRDYALALEVMADRFKNLAEENDMLALKP